MQHSLRGLMRATLAALALCFFVTGSYASDNREDVARLNDRLSMLEEHLLRRGDLRGMAEETHSLLVELTDKYNKASQNEEWGAAYDMASVIARHQLLAGYTQTARQIAVAALRS